MIVLNDDGRISSISAFLDQVPAGFDPHADHGEHPRTGEGQALSVVKALVGDGMTMMVFTHEMGLAREVGDSLVFMDGGVIVENGAPRDVLENPQHERTQLFLSEVL